MLKPSSSSLMWKGWENMTIKVCANFQCQSVQSMSACRSQICGGIFFIQGLLEVVCKVASSLICHLQMKSWLRSKRVWSTWQWGVGLLVVVIVLVMVTIRFFQGKSVNVPGIPSSGKWGGRLIYNTNSWISGKLSWHCLPVAEYKCIIEPLVYQNWSHLGGSLVWQAASLGVAWKGCSWDEMLVTGR